MTVISSAWKVVKSTALVTQSTIQRKAEMTTCLLTFLKEKKALTNSPLLLKRLRYRLVMNLQQCLFCWMLSFYYKKSLCRAVTVMKTQCYTYSYIARHIRSSYTPYLLHFATLYSWANAISVIIQVCPSLIKQREHDSRHIEEFYQKYFVIGLSETEHIFIIPSNI